MMNWADIGKMSFIDQILTFLLVVVCHAGLQCAARSVPPVKWAFTLKSKRIKSFVSKAKV